MDDASSSMKHWITFAGAVLVVAVLYWAQAVLVPIALAILIAFVLAPPVNWVERWIGRVPAVLLIVTLVFLVLGLGGWGLVRQMNHLANDLPTYRVNILAKIADVRGANKGGTVEKVQQTIDDINTDIGKDDERGARAPQRVVVDAATSAIFPAFAWLGPIMGPLGTFGLVVVLVLFMLLERRDLRDRLIGVIGHGRLTVTTKAFDEASSRVSKQLLMQSLVNAIYGIVAGLGLYFLGVPYAMVWGILGAALRFVPYLGPVLGAAAPLLVSLAALPGWTDSLLVFGLLAVLELITNLWLETVLYADAAGVSEVALLIAVAFWTWLWGPLGLLMATPLTVCFVVLGKHVPGLTFVGTLMADNPQLAADQGYYQRLLARDPGEAADLIECHIKSQPWGTVYDALLLPALNYAERNRLEDRLSSDEENAVIEATRELLIDVADSIKAKSIAAVDVEPSIEPLRVLGYAANGVADELALAMLAQAVSDLPIAIDVNNTRLLASDLVSLVRTQNVSVICIADLPPSPSSKTRYLVKRLHAALPDVRIIVGRWSPPALADENSQALKEAGATLVATTIVDTRAYFETLVNDKPSTAAQGATVDRKGLPPEESTTQRSEPQQPLTVSA